MMPENVTAPVIFAHQNKPRPNFPYGTLWVNGAGTRQGAIDEVRYNEDDERFEQHGLRTTTVSLNIYGPNANDYMSRIRDTLDWPGVIEEFASVGVSHQGETGPNDLTAFEDTKSAERSQLDLMISYDILKTPIEENTVHPIEKADITFESAPTNPDHEDETFSVETPDSETP
jgi:hypothetical protein